MIKSRVGSKGELFPPKELRERLGLHPHTPVIYTIKDGKLIVEPIISVKELLKKSPEKEISLKDFQEFRRELWKRIES